MFSLFNFSSIFFQRGQLTPFAPLCGRPWWVRCRHETGSHFVTQRPSDPGIQRPGDPLDPVTLFYNELLMSTYVAYKRLQWARGLPVLSLFGVRTLLESKILKIIYKMSIFQ